ncbi:hypothetical protein SPRG_14310 [Saprolegnia parasitica CBS 223.65]|uniref:START domain-containing protein n=1 Tax=Saprolegnia parasitica (strain CBS 223.65) TaxID=695850 RepID=A0A067BQ99_SAPPC|nr:hypothetical protein SPRG_14310 [Saprolegnia parasitica CBS 223.65]KDO20438.1 hypothetical protein SPRG_14310 [Saprolegnia parasitica CBS 223.65]|eukprot:XP_012208828.1 hypothetical protein SPRG_14310 [Saprolegnia parasitica CBS 223.65]
MQFEPASPRPATLPPLPPARPLPPLSSICGMPRQPYPAATSYPPYPEPSAKANDDDDDDDDADVMDDEDEHKKTRRREQIARSARRHRSKQKEELVSLRQQVYLLQGEMEALRVKHKTAHPDGSDFTEWEEKALAQRRKRKKAEDENGMLRGLLHDQATFTETVRDMWIKSPLITQYPGMTPSILAGDRSFNHLGRDLPSRIAALQRIAETRMELAYEFVMRETHAFPSTPGHLDIKLNGTGQDIDIKLIRVCEIDGVDHHQVIEALIHSVINDPAKLLMVDACTRYGRASLPVSIDQTRYSMESLFVIRHRSSNSIGMVSWDSVDQDDLHPIPDEYTIRNEEVGSVLLNTCFRPDGAKYTTLRFVLHSRPPVKALAKPSSKINEAFLTVFCRRAEALEKQMRTKLSMFPPVSCASESSTSSPSSPSLSTT